MGAAEHHYADSRTGALACSAVARAACTALVGRGGGAHETGGCRRKWGATNNNGYRKGATTNSHACGGLLGVPDGNRGGDPHRTPSDARMRPPSG